MATNRDNLKLVYKKQFLFVPHRPDDQESILLQEANLKDDTQLLVFERGGQVRCVDLASASYHHVIQGELAGEPYLITF